jgi:hypothetical protein
MITTQQHYELPGGTLKVLLVTDHALTTAEQADLEELAAACRAFCAHHRVMPAPAADDIDEALWALGGEEAVTAG